MVRLLLKGGADVNAEGDRYDNALQAASAGDHQSLIRLLTDAASTFSSICDSRHVGDEDNTVSFSGSTSSTVNLALPPTLERSFPASSVTSLENKLPEEIFKLLTFEVFLDPDMKDLCEKMLKSRGSLYSSIFSSARLGAFALHYTQKI